VKLVNWYDQSELVTQSVSSVRDAVMIGLVLAALVLLLFLRSWRVTLIAVIAVPATLAATVLVLSILGMSFNIMTLGGIAAAVGLLIDDVIVMVEHIARRAGAVGEDGQPLGNAAVIPAAREFLMPLTGSSMATLIVFLPLSFLTGVTGAFSKALSVTMAAALALSWAITAFVVPLLARRLVDFGTWRDPGKPGRAFWPGGMKGCLIAFRRGRGCWRRCSCRCWRWAISAIAMSPPASCPRSMRAASSWITLPRRAPRWRKPAGWWGRSMPC
jgi:multidrug efflux pump subunit AcrB